MRVLMRKTATWGGAAVLAGSALIGLASPASAATTCYSRGCFGLDPSTTTCQNDAITVSTGWTEVELRYSPSCRAAWARKSNGSVGSTLSVANTALATYSTHVAAYSTGWTLMVDDADLQSVACEVLDGGGKSCTGFY